MSRNIKQMRGLDGQFIGLSTTCEEEKPKQTGFGPNGRLLIQLTVGIKYARLSKPMVEELHKTLGEILDTF